MESVSSDFDRNPPIDVRKYDESIRQFCAAYDSFFPMTHAALRSKLADQADILIVGAGTGMEIAAFGRQNPHWRMTGVDPSEDMLGLARKKSPKKTWKTQSGYSTVSLMNCPKKSCSTPPLAFWLCTFFRTTVRNFSFCRVLPPD